MLVDWDPPPASTAHLCVDSWSLLVADALFNPFQKTGILWLIKRNGSLGHGSSWSGLALRVISRLTTTAMPMSNPSICMYIYILPPPSPCTCIYVASPIPRTPNFSPGRNCDSTLWTAPDSRATTRALSLGHKFTRGASKDYAGSWFENGLSRV